MMIMSKFAGKRYIEGLIYLQTSYSDKDGMQIQGRVFRFNDEKLYDTLSSYLEKHGKIHMYDTNVKEVGILPCLEVDIEGTHIEVLILERVILNQLVMDNMIKMRFGGYASNLYIRE